MTRDDRFERAARARRRPTSVTRQALAELGAALEVVTSCATFAPDAALEALEALEADGDDPGVGWDADHARQAFDDRGVLTGPLPLYCASSGRAELQVAFAYLGLAPHIPPDDDDDDAWLAPDAGTRACDLVSIVAAFDALRAAGVEAEPCFSITRTDGFAELAGNGPRGAIFWHGQAHDAFDADGDLAEALYLHWRGDLATIARVLRAALAGSGLALQVPDDEETTFVIARAPAGGAGR